MYQRRATPADGGDRRRCRMKRREREPERGSEGGKERGAPLVFPPTDAGNYVNINFPRWSAYNSEDEHLRMDEEKLPT